jgi:hypothetical protein
MPSHSLRTDGFSTDCSGFLSFVANLTHEGYFDRRSHRRVEDRKSALGIRARPHAGELSGVRECKSGQTEIECIVPIPARTVLADGWHCGLLLIFDNSLNKIVLSFSEKELDWFEWSKEGELRRKENHDAFLREQLGPPPCNFSWGRVVSVIDSHDSSARISIRYA